MLTRKQNTARKQNTVADFWGDIKSKLTGLAGGWASYSALGSFLLYGLGYFSVRFHLTTLGIGTDLAVLDERYLFTGAKFLIYLASTFPIVVLIALVLAIILAVPICLICWLYKTIKTRSNKVAAAGAFIFKIVIWVAQPRQLALLGIVISVVLIQFVMRQCYFFSNLLLAPSLPPTMLNLEALLLDEDGSLQSLYFSGLLVGATLTASVLYSAHTRMGASFISKVLVSLLAILVGIQILLLPVNYGVFIMDKEIPKVIAIGDERPLQSGDEAWLVWEGSQGMTYLIQTNTVVEGTQQAQKKRSLVTLPRKDFKKLEIVRYDQIIKYIFSP